MVARLFKKRRLGGGFDTSSSGGLQNAWLGRARIVVPLSHSLVLIEERVRLELLARHSQRIMMNGGGALSARGGLRPAAIGFPYRRGGGATQRVNYGYCNSRGGTEHAQARFVFQLRRHL